MSTQCGASPSDVAHDEKGCGKTWTREKQCCTLPPSNAEALMIRSDSLKCGELPRQAIPWAIEHGLMDEIMCKLDFVCAVPQRSIPLAVYMMVVRSLFDAPAQNERATLAHMRRIESNGTVGHTSVLCFRDGNGSLHEAVEVPPTLAKLQTDITVVSQEEVAEQLARGNAYDLFAWNDRYFSKAVRRESKLPLRIPYHASLKSFSPKVQAFCRGYWGLSEHPAHPDMGAFRAAGAFAAAVTTPGEIDLHTSDVKWLRIDSNRLPFEVLFECVRFRKVHLPADLVHLCRGQHEALVVLAPVASATWEHVPPKRRDLSFSVLDLNGVPPRKIPEEVDEWEENLPSNFLEELNLAHKSAETLMFLSTEVCADHVRASTTPLRDGYSISMLTGRVLSADGCTLDANFEFKESKISVASTPVLGMLEDRLVEANPFGSSHAFLHDFDLDLHSEYSARVRRMIDEDIPRSFKSLKRRIDRSDKHPRHSELKRLLQTVSASEASAEEEERKSTFRQRLARVAPPSLLSELDDSLKSLMLRHKVGTLRSPELFSILAESIASLSKWCFAHGVPMLAVSVYPHGMEELSLVNANPLSDLSMRSIPALASTLHTLRLDHVDMRGRLGHLHSLTLQTLSLIHSNLRVDDALALANVCKQGVRNLFVGGRVLLSHGDMVVRGAPNRLRAEGARVLAPHLKFIERLNVSGNRIESAGAVDILGGIYSSKTAIAHLGMDDNDISFDATVEQKVLQCLSLPTLLSLSLSHNAFNDEFGCNFAWACAKTPSLLRLCLGGSSAWADRSWLGLSETLSNGMLTELHVSHPKMPSKIQSSVVTFLRSINRSRLVTLDIGGGVLASLSSAQLKSSLALADTPLRHLSTARTKFSNEQMKLVLQAVTESHLEVLDLSQTWGVKDKRQLEKCIDKLQTLRTLMVRDVAALSNWHGDEGTMCRVDHDALSMSEVLEA